MMSFGKRGKGEGEFNHCWSARLDSEGCLWVVDRDNHRIQKFDTEGNLMFKFGMHGKDESGQGQFDNPSDIAFDRQGCIYVTDEFNYRVQKFDSQGNFVLKFGKSGYGEDEFAHPRGIAIDNEQ